MPKPTMLPILFLFRGMNEPFVYMNCYGLHLSEHYVYNVLSKGGVGLLKV